jgi:hypothetical protein
MSVRAENAIWEWGMLEVVQEEAQEEKAKAGEEAQEAEAAYAEEKVVVVVKVGRQRRWRRQWWWRHRRQRQSWRKQSAEEEEGEEASSERVGMGWAALQGIGADGCEEYEELVKKLVLEVKRKKIATHPSRAYRQRCCGGMGNMLLLLQ